MFMIWEHGEEALQEFLSHLNSAHATIKFTAEYSEESINFLDVTVLKEGNHLSTDLYAEPTDTLQYLHASSSHIKRAIPYGQALWLNRICSTNEFLDKRCDNLEAWLINRGYSITLLFLNLEIFCPIFISSSYLIKNTKLFFLVYLLWLLKREGV